MVIGSQVQVWNELFNSLHKILTSKEKATEIVIINK